MVFDKEVVNSLFLKVPAGAVGMRDDRRQRRWVENIDSFELSKFPVTQELYEAVVKSNPSTFKGSKRPVENISWLDAVTFCNKLSQLLERQPCYELADDIDKLRLNPAANGIRLPSEAEWQFACQAGGRTARYGELHEIAWFKMNSNQTSQEVGEKLPNDWGFYDMLGNVWEWCTDIYDESVYGTYRVFRGGGWCDDERSVMATTRRRSHPVSFKIDDLGFRIARNAP